MLPAPVPYLDRLYLRPDAELDQSTYPGSLPFLSTLDLRFTKPVTFFVGENGSGKSTLVEAIAELSRLPVAGGGRNELGHSHGPHGKSDLAPLLRAAFRRTPRDGYFFRAEFQAHFATLLEERKADPDFIRSGDPYARYGGRSLHTRSHGEAFLAMFTSWMRPGMILMDEPEAALSPQRQLALLVQMSRLAKRRDVQFIIATHSPIILGFPNARIYSCDQAPMARVAFEDLDHVVITRDFLNAPERYLRYLQE